MERTVRLVLVDAAGVVLGALPPFALGEPWWQQVGEVVAGARARFGVTVAVLRLLAADRPGPPGGAVTFLAELSGAPPTGLAPVDGFDLSPHPLRAPYADPGGPARSVAWATTALSGAGWSGGQPPRSAPGTSPRPGASTSPAPRRGPPLCRWIRERLTSWRPAPGEEVPDLAALIANMDARIAAMPACGLPESLVHGDLYAGNVRLDGGPPVVLG